MIMRENLIKQSATALRAAHEHDKATSGLVEYAEVCSILALLSDDQLLRSCLFGLPLTQARA